jgi:hypothetical protein
MSHAFHIAHATSGRTRIKWAGEREDRASVVDVAAQIAAVEGVDHALPRPGTGSIIIEHEQVQWPQLESELADRLSLQFSTPAIPEPRTAMETINRGIDQTNAMLKGINTDLGSVTVLMMLILAVVQAYRGQVGSSSASFLWYALSIATMARGSDNTVQNADAESTA